MRPTLLLILGTEANTGDCGGPDSKHPSILLHYGLDRPFGCFPLIQPFRSQGRQVTRSLMVMHQLDLLAQMTRVIRSVVYAVLRGAPPRRGLLQEIVSKTAAKHRPAFRPS